MAIAWRLADPRYADDLEGTGNRIHGARWNSPGRGVLYCSENLSLCVLETLVHLPPQLRRRLPARVALKLHFPDGAETTEVVSLPTTLVGETCRAKGDQWLDMGETLVLRAPSIVVPQERNIMFNPAHPRMKDVRVLDSLEFTFDDRLLHR